MKKNSLVILGTVVVIVTLVGSYFLFAGGQNQTVKVASYALTDKQKPKAEAKTTLSDMGQIKVSDQKDSVFTLKNTGGKPLQLFNISSSCGCTAGQIIIEGKESKEFGMHSQSDEIFEIGPQKEAKVKVIYRPYVMPVYGLVEREVYVSTNDPTNQKLVFKVKAYVK
ncbi:DUF1573 domain-containing protein [Candidatus Roizmanbacteria bacterium]|nr:DUF1573 domain-containing protein [Candidatus Roizmanbacteria bacterium]